MELDPEYQDAVKQLFYYYIEEEYYNEQLATGADLAEQLMTYATKGIPHVVESVEQWLDYDLTFGETVIPVTDEDVRRRMLEVLNGYPERDKLAAAAQVVWRKYREEKK